MVLTLLSIIAPHIALAETDAVSEEPAIKLEAAYTADYLVNARGGISQDDAYLDNLDLVLTVNGEKAFHWPGATITASVLHNNRATFSDRVVGDKQVLSNIDVDGSFRLYELWLEQALGWAQIKAGLVNLNSEFDVNETGSLFIGSSHGIGPDFSQIGENGPSIFPITGLAALVNVRLAPTIRLRAGIFEGVPGSVVRPRRTVLRLDAHEGQLVVGEVEFNPWPESRLVIGARRLSGRGATSTSQTSARDAQFGAYVLLEGPLAKIGSGSLRGFARYGYASPSVHEIGGYIGAGVVYSGPLLAGKDTGEELGLSLGTIRNTDQHMRGQALAGSPSDRYETSFELTYRVQATSWLELHPSLHYIVNPGANPGLRDALVVGLRFEVAWQDAL